jgi:hypothetical protein
MTNVGALDQVVNFLRAHPNLHRQHVWLCGSAGCVAGWAVALDQGAKAGDALTRRILEEDHYQDQPGHVGDRAATLLGLTTDEAYHLFQSTDSEEAALELASALIARDKGEATADDRATLAGYCLPTKPAGDAA